MVLCSFFPVMISNRVNDDDDGEVEEEKQVGRKEGRNVAKGVYLLHSAVHGDCWTTDIKPLAAIAN